MGSELDLSLIVNPYHQMELAYLSTSMGDFPGQEQVKG